MAQRAIEGQNVLLRAKLGGDYIPFACATSVDFYYDTELIEKATVGMYGFKSWISGMGEWGMTLNTVTYVQPTTESYTVFDTLLDSLRKIGLFIELSFEDNDGNLKTITGHVLIPHTGITSPVDGFSEDTIEFKGDGAFAINTELITPDTADTEVKTPIDFTAAGGETSLTYPELIGATLLYVGRDGTGKEVIQSDDPNDKQVKFISTTGTIFFAASDPLGPGEWILILYK
jgi:hypothetical protein